jgi:DNA-binding CsgD family transcriptional regulator
VNTDVLLSYFAGLPAKHQEDLVRQLERLESFSRVFYAVIVEEDGKYKFAYASLSIETLTGYSIANFSYHGGSPFFYSVTPPACRKSVLDQELSYLKKARQADFDHSVPFIIDIHGAIQHCSNRIMDVRMSALVIEFTRHCTPKFAINVWQVAEGLDETSIASMKDDVAKILINIWQLCASIRSSPVKSDQDGPIQLSYPLYDHEFLTTQEFKVLKLLANGLSTSNISKELNITDNTTETYRRHLLEKFRAANSAEMIKKASKIYWLE